MYVFYNLFTKQTLTEYLQVPGTVPSVEDTRMNKRPVLPSRSSLQCCGSGSMLSV